MMIEIEIDRSGRTQLGRRMKRERENMVLRVQDITGSVKRVAYG